LIHVLVEILIFVERRRFLQNDTFLSLLVLVVKSLASLSETINVEFHENCIDFVKTAADFMHLHPIHLDSRRERLCMYVCLLFKSDL